MRIGVISDTHGLLLPQVAKVFSGVQFLIHAGDIGSQQVLDGLTKIARVVAVRGNVDIGYTAPLFPDTRRFTLEGVDIFLCHQPERAMNLVTPPMLIIHGHTHIPRNEMRDGVLWFNPGTAGKPKISGCYSVGIVTVEKGKVLAELIELAPPSVVEGM